MKIAILYSGSLRNLAETIDNNLVFFQGMKIDLYFSVWDYIGYIDHLNAPDHFRAKRLLVSDQIVTPDLIRSLIPSNISIKAIKIEHYNPSDYQLDLINGSSPNLNAQYYKILDCFNLVENPQEYDFLVRLRCDILLNNKMEHSLIHQLVNDDKIIFNTKIWFNHPRQGGYDINEMIWIAKAELMRKACHIYGNATKINQVISNRGQTHKNYGENICCLNLEAEDILNKVHLFDFDYHVLR